jgi:hypothetical protein
VLFALGILISVGTWTATMFVRVPGLETLLLPRLIGGSLLSAVVAYALPMKVRWAIGGVVILLNVPGPSQV